MLLRTNNRVCGQTVLHSMDGWGTSNKSSLAIGPWPMISQLKNHFPTLSASTGVIGAGGQMVHWVDSSGTIHHIHTPGPLPSALASAENPSSWMHPSKRCAPINLDMPIHYSGHFHLAPFISAAIPGHSQPSAHVANLLWHHCCITEVLHTSTTEVPPKYHPAEGATRESQKYPTSTIKVPPTYHPTRKYHRGSTEALQKKYHQSTTPQNAPHVNHRITPTNTTKVPPTYHACRTHHSCITEVQHKYHQTTTNVPGHL